jgi:3'-phosphoadenosine 5'-phosphosulfate sulfotransferase (PAPS reductase)/FAD synthetase
MNNLFISFSGGKTSAYMTYKILTSPYKDNYDEIVVIFANTGEEHPNTLEFVNNCDKHLGFNTIWIESDIQGKGVGARPKIVTYETASRNGEPFEAFCAKHGIPNMISPQCTARLKTDPMHYYVRKELGWGKEYDTAIGIRMDEQRRVSKTADVNKIVYPLIDWFPTDKIDVNDFWEDMPFTLNIEEHQGNCKWCWKKSLNKHFKLLEQNPEWFDFPQRMEEQYSTVRLDLQGNPQYFFRGRKSTIMLKQEFADFKQNNGQLSFSFNPDENSGCSESCEVYGTE